jgi:putative MATE family efflux protein
VSNTRTGHDLTTGPVSTQLRRQAVPFSFGLLAIFSFEAVDLFFIAQLGSAELTAVSFALPVIWLVYGIGIGFEAGAASCVSRAVGRKDEAYARRLTTDTVVLGLLVALGMVAVGLATIDSVFGLLGTTAELMPIVREYMQVWYWVAPLDLALWTMLAAIRARGNSLLEAKIITAAALLNLVLDPLLIFGLFGLPRMEVAGAALASVLSTGTMLVFASWYLGARLGVFARIMAPVRVVFASWLHMLQIGIPAMVTNAIIPVSSGIVVAMLASTGVDSVAGYGIAVRIEPMALIPFYALSAVSSPFFGQNFGAGHFDRLVEARQVITRFCLLFGLGLALVTSLAAPFIAGAYTDSADIREVTLLYIWMVSWSWGAHGIVMSVNASFNGSGRPLPAVVISSARVIFVLLPLAFIGRWLFGTAGLFAAILVSNLLMGWVAWLWLGRHISAAQERSAPIPPQSSYG